MRLELRESVPWWLSLSAPIMAIALSLLMASLLIVWAGESILAAFHMMAVGAFGSTFALTETLSRAIPLTFTGLAAAIAFRARFYNIGAEGQLYCGALAATLVGTGLLELNSFWMIPLLFLVGALAGGLALLLPWYLKTRLSVDEVVTTLLLNFVILLLVSYTLEGPLRDPMSMGWPQAAPIIDSGVLPALVPRTRLHAGLYVALAAAMVLWLLLRFSVFGFSVKALGLNSSAARHAGIPAARTLFWVAMLSGALAGAAGVSEVAGLKGYLTLDLSPGFGYTGIAVAMLANLHPLGVVLSATFLAGISVGADSMGRALGVPSYIADIMVACAVLSVLIGLMLSRYRIRR
ncbi:ABC transporter permease [Granulosicoccus sp. 3-233]|uniref:ABC transporter permease n=1 Tax=Granulosicoccus sp. 3-233 TaxID=3417969 RepID=UPI003D344FC5